MLNKLDFVANRQPYLLVEGNARSIQDAWIPNGSISTQLDPLFPSILWRVPSYKTYRTQTVNINTVQYLSNAGLNSRKTQNCPHCIASPSNTTVAQSYPASTSGCPASCDILWHKIQLKHSSDQIKYYEQHSRQHCRAADCIYSILTNPFLAKGAHAFCRGSGVGFVSSEAIPEGIVPAAVAVPTCTVPSRRWLVCQRVFTSLTFVSLSQKPKRSKCGKIKNS